MVRPRDLNTEPAKTDKAGPDTPTQTRGAGWWLSNVALIMLTVVAVVRPLTTETYDSAGTPFAASIPDIAEPTPVRTLVFDSVVIGVFLAVVVARTMDGKRFVRTGLEAGLFLVIAAAVLSCFVAGNKRLAINGTIDWLCGPLLAITLVQVMRRPWHRTLLVAAILGSAAAQAVQCFDQYFFTYPETVRMYEADKAAFWAAQAVELDSSKVELFERRMLAREASGFLPHSNVTGSYLAMCGLAAVGVALAGLRRLRNATSSLDLAATAFTTLAALLILGATALTGSRGAMLSIVIGATFWILSLKYRAWIAQHRRVAFAIAWIAVTIGLAATATYGLMRDRLPGASLQFRWEYWKASALMIADHPWTGVGRENFGRHYLQYKSIASPEEIANPHNLFVQAAADWGIIGLVGLAAMLISGSWHLAGRVRSRAESDPLANQNLGADASGRPRSPATSAALVVVGFATLVLGVPLLGSQHPGFQLLFCVMVGLPWLATSVSANRVMNAHKHSTEFDKLLLGGATAGLVAFLVHDLINFALFSPATSTTFFALCAACFATCETDPQPPRHGSMARMLVPFAGAVALLIVLCLGWWPVARASSFLGTLRSQLRSMAQTTTPPLPPVDQLLQPATESDRLDPTPLLAVAELAFAQASADPAQSDRLLATAAQSLDRANARDPFSVSLQRLRTRVLLAKAFRTREMGDYASAIDAAERALALYPNDPHGHVALGDALLKAAEATTRAEWASDAADAYQHALKLDDSRPAWETIRRFRNRERDAISEKIRQAQGIQSRN